MTDTTKKVLLGGAGLILVVLAVRLLPLQDWLVHGVGQARDAGPIGAAVFGLVYVVATVAFLPASVFTLAAGLAWGPLGGLAIVWPAAVVGAVLSFALGRTVLREPVERRLRAYPRFLALDDALGDDGFTLVALLRLSPVFPFNMLNYGLGLTAITLKDYTLATALGILPGTFLYVYLGSTLGNIAQIFDGSADAGTSGQLLYWGGLLATLAVTVLVTRRARAALDARLQEAS